MADNISLQKKGNIVHSEMFLNISVIYQVGIVRKTCNMNFYQHVGRWQKRSCYACKVVKENAC